MTRAADIVLLIFQALCDGGNDDVDNGDVDNGDVDDADDDDGDVDIC